MAGEGFFIFLIIILFAIILLIGVGYDQKQKRGVISYFTSKGYSQTNATKLNFIDNKTGMRYEVEKFHKGAGKNRKTFYRLSVLVESNTHYKFTITKRGGLSKLFGVNKGTLNTIHDDFNIRSTNPMQIQFIFSDVVLDVLEKFFRYGKSLDVNSQNGLLVVEIELGYNNSRLFSSVNFVEFLISKLLQPDIFDNMEFEEYVCFNCKEEISYFGDFCISCGVIAPKCVICFDDPEPNEDVILFDCCKSYSHKKHALTWINTENSCPSCRATKPILKPIKEIRESN